MTKPKKRTDPTKARKLADAVAGVKDGTYSNAYEANKATGVPVRSIYHRLGGGKSRRDANAHSQHLTPAEESALVKYIERMAGTGHPVKHSFLRELAEELRKARLQREG